MVKDEKYIKELLKNAFIGVGNFQQFEFTPTGGGPRPDFVILYDDRFTYFEIKGETDVFDRLPSQINSGLGLFTEMFLVIPICHLERVLSIGVKGTTGIYIVEELEKGNIYPYTRQDYKGICTINSVSEMLWADELRYYIRKINPDFSCVDSLSGTKMGLDKMTMATLPQVFRLFYSNKDALRILNEVLTSRNFNYRKQREQLKLSKEKI